MGLHKGRASAFVPAGLCDAYDETNTFPGGCFKLNNLVFDQANPGKIIARPGATVLTSFPGFTTPGVVSCALQVGTRIYGMIASGLTAGFDQPFSYNVATNTFDTMTGVTATNVPATLASSGTWIPPDMDVVGNSVLIAHTGYSGTGTNFFGVINITTVTAPAYSSSNLATNALPVVPTAVKQFNNRAWFAEPTSPPGVVFSDILAPTTRTNASQVLTYATGGPITALKGLPISTLISGTLQALIVFQADSVQQITGDQSNATPNLASNNLSTTIGTVSPRSVALASEGILFAATDGIYCVDINSAALRLLQQGQVPDVSSPFLNATTPSRMSGGYSNGIYRVCFDTIVRGVAYTGNDYWFDTHYRKWNGWHSFPTSLVVGYQNYFIIASVANPGALYQSQTFPNVLTGYLDNGSTYQCFMETTTFKKPPEVEMSISSFVESEIELLGVSANLTYNLAAVDQNDTTLSSTTALLTGRGSLWGTAVWGSFLWSSGVFAYISETVPWTNVVIGTKIAIQASFVPTVGGGLGTFKYMLQSLGYMNSRG